MFNIFTAAGIQSISASWFELYANTLLKGTAVLALVFILILTRRRMQSELKHFLVLSSLNSFLVILSISIVLKAGLMQCLHILNKPLLEIPKQRIPGQSLKLIETAAKGKAGWSGAGFISGLSENLILLAFIVWAAGITFCLAKMTIGLILTYKIKRNAHLVDDIVETQLLSELMQKINLKQGVKIYMVDYATSPMTAGIIKPYIIVPREYRKWSAEHCKAVFLHELFHIKRRDSLIHITAYTVCAIFWINPLVWVAEKLLRQEREYICDRNVIASGIKPSQYAGDLLESVKSLSQRSRLIAFNNPMAQTTKVEKRILNILTPGNSKGNAIKQLKLPAVILIILLSFLISAANILASDINSVKSTKSKEILPELPIPAYSSQPNEGKHIKSKIGSLSYTGSYNY